MKFCEKCRNEVSDTAKFCPECGTTNAFTANFCKRDGVPLKENAQPAEASEKEDLGQQEGKTYSSNEEKEPTLPPQADHEISPVLDSNSCTVDLSRPLTIRSKGIPQLLPNEQLIFESEIGTAMPLVIGIVLCFVPPFVFGPIWLYLVFRMDKRSKVLVSDKRILYCNAFIGKTYLVHSIPLTVIRGLIIHYGNGILNRVLFNAANVKIWVNGLNHSMCLENVKNPKLFIDKVKTQMSCLKISFEDMDTEPLSKNAATSNDEKVMPL